MRVLVTGASSPLGQSVLRSAISNGDQAIALTRNPAALKESFGNSTQYEHFSLGSVFSERSSTSQTLKSADAIIHVASITPKTAREGDSMFDHNIQIAEYLALTLADSLNLKVMVNVSTASVYSKTSEIIDASTVVAPDSEYACSKLQAEEILHTLSPPRGIFSVRLPGIFGRGQTGSSIQSLVEKTVHRRPIEVALEKNVLTNSLISLEDAGEFLHGLTGDNGAHVSSRFPIAAGNPMTLAEIVLLIEDYLGLERTGAYSELPSSRRIIDFQFAEINFGFSPTSVFQILVDYLNHTGSSPGVGGEA